MRRWGDGRCMLYSRNWKIAGEARAQTANIYMLIIRFILFLKMVLGSSYFFHFTVEESEA